MSNEFIGARVNEARKARGLTQAQLAEEVGLSPNYIGLIERGVNNPSLNSILAIADALGVNPGYFIAVNNKTVREPECVQYENVIKDEIKTLNKQQLLWMLEIIRLLRKYVKGDEEYDGQA